MAHKIKKEFDGKGLIIAFTGVVEADEIDEIQDQINSDEFFPHLSYQIWDYTKAKDINLSTDQIQKIAMKTAVASGRNPKMRIAIIPRKTSHNVLGTTFHSFENVWGVNESKSFRDINDARDWGKRIKKS